MTTLTLILNFIHEYVFVYAWLIVTTFINIVAPTSGATVVNPVVAYFTDPQRAIGTTDTKNLTALKKMLPYSVIGAVMGGYFVSNLNVKLLALIAIIVSTYYIYKTVRQVLSKARQENRVTSMGSGLISIFTGFLQGSGMPGSDIRTNYLRTILSEVSVRAVSSVLGLVNFFIAGGIIFLHNKLTHKDIIFILSIVPLLMLAQAYGKKFLEKMEDSHAKLLASALSLLGVILLTYKYFL
jgi:uncharacterized membrane protein YfcA